MLSIYNQLFGLAMLNMFVYMKLQVKLWSDQKMVPKDDIELFCVWTEIH